MNDLLLAAHSGWRWIVVLALAFASVDGLLGWAGRRDWQPRSTTVARVMTITYDIQVALGLLLYVSTRAWATQDMFYSKLHPSVMLVGLLVVHTAAKRTRSATTSRARHAWLGAGALIALMVAAAGGAGLR